MQVKLEAKRSSPYFDKAAPELAEGLSTNAFVALACTTHPITTPWPHGCKHTSAAGPAGPA
mgnify:FL=1